ncbi:RES domain-containing protein [Actimicrobium sp. GrIS 1.19]|uniref:RES family NAD+ phosphorylase n=1 Tax=Actimicrobium sp. GrIS 1.19 TaxID=3071708 RepID=UPI002E09BF96|nr:RES domain-containing protein [Actimicrobium sp. GrIS 1.19]
MTVSVWRIAVEAPAYAADDLAGTGAKLSGGRWNRVGTPMLYCASNIALATLETVVHIRGNPLPLNRFLVRVDIPDAVWETRTVLNPLPGGWDALPAGLASIRAGEQWVAGAACAILLVPSVIVPDEQNVLINPAHRDTGNISATTLKKWHYDPRFF